jgi:hypothetical protein
LVPFALFLWACDSSDSGDADDGDQMSNEFAISITPTASESAAVETAVQKDLNGFSFFVDTDDLDDVQDEAFVIYFTGGSSFSAQSATQGLFGFLARESGQPGTGDYTITEDAEAASSEFIGWLYEDLGSSQGAPYYLIEEGTLSLSTSDDDRVSGTISGTGTAYTITNTGVTTEAVEFSGSFGSSELDVYLPFGDFTGGLQ